MHSRIEFRALPKGTFWTLPPSSFPLFHALIDDHNGQEGIGKREKKRRNKKRKEKETKKREERERREGKEGKIDLENPRSRKIQRAVTTKIVPS